MLSVCRNNGFCAITCLSWLILLKFYHNYPWHRIMIRIDLRNSSTTYYQTRSANFAIKGVFCFCEECNFFIDFDVVFFVYVPYKILFYVVCQYILYDTCHFRYIWWSNWNQYQFWLCDAEVNCFCNYLG
jgi:hypothetical protein